MVQFFFVLEAVICMVWVAAACPDNNYLIIMRCLVFVEGNPVVSCANHRYATGRDSIFQISNLFVNRSCFRVCSLSNHVLKTGKVSNNDF